MTKRKVEVEKESLNADLSEEPEDDLEIVPHREFGHIEVRGATPFRESERGRDGERRDDTATKMMSEYLLHPKDEYLDYVTIIAPHHLAPLTAAKTLAIIPETLYIGEDPSRLEAQREYFDTHDPLNEMIQVRNRYAIAVNGTGRKDGVNLVKLQREREEDRGLFTRGLD